MAGTESGAERSGIAEEIDEVLGERPTGRTRRQSGGALVENL
jgi:hypothetical protein